MTTIVAWTVGLVAVVALVAGTQSAVNVSENVMHTGGVAVGAIVSGADDLVKGFNAAKRDAGKPSPAAGPSHKSAHHHKHHGAKG